MAIPDYQKLMLPVLRLAFERETRVPDVASQIAADLALSADEQEEMLPSGRQRVLHNRIHWAKFYLSKAGLLDSPGRGRFIASDLGKALLATDPLNIDVELLKSYPAFAAFYARGLQGGVSAETPAVAVAAVSASTPEEQIDAAHRVLHSALKADLLQRILDNHPTFFERVIVDLLVAMGYGGSHDAASLRLGRTGDGGVDGVIDEDRLGLDRIYVQAKRYAPHTSVGRPEVQGFVGSLVGLGATKGVFVTTSTFSTPALEYVRHLPQRIILIHGERLCELLIEYGVGVRVSRAIEVKRLDEDFFEEE